jgi:hypothetical protein
MYTGWVWGVCHSIALTLFTGRHNTETRPSCYLFHEITRTHCQNGKKIPEKTSEICGLQKGSCQI